MKPTERKTSMEWSTPPHFDTTHKTESLNENECITVTWQKSPNTDRKKAAARQLHPDSEINALEGILQNIHNEKKISKKRGRGNDETQISSSAQVSAQLLKSWLAVSTDENSSCENGIHPENIEKEVVNSPKNIPLKMISTSRRKNAQHVSIIRKKMADMSTKKGPGNLLNLLDELNNQIEKSVGSVQRNPLQPIIPEVSQARQLERRAPIASNQSDVKPSARFHDKLMAARKLRQAKRNESRIRENISKNISNKPRPEQIPITFLQQKPNSAKLSYLGNSSQCNSSTQPRLFKSHFNNVGTKAIQQSNLLACTAPDESLKMYPEGKKQSDIKCIPNPKKKLLSKTDVQAIQTHENVLKPRDHVKVDEEQVRNAFKIKKQDLACGLQKDTGLDAASSHNPGKDITIQNVPVANTCEISQVAFDDDDIFLTALADVASKYDNVKKPSTNAVENLNDLKVERGPLGFCSASMTSSCFTRFKILDVSSITCDSNSSALKMDVTESINDTPRIVILKDEWSETQVRAGDFVNIVWSNQNSKDKNPIVVDGNTHFLILHPDLLVSPTRIAGSVRCLRRSVLAEEIQNYTASRYTAMGNAKHELVERALIPSGSGEINSQRSLPNFTTGYLTNAVNDIVGSARIVEELYAAGLSEESARQELCQLIPALQQWAKEYMALEGGTNGPLIQFCNSFIRRISITSVIATEEKIWSPIWGLKGQIDIMLEIDISVPQSNVSKERSALSKKMLIPLELKTGFSLKDEHYAQVILYSLLLKDRYHALSIPGVKGQPAPLASGLLMHLSQPKFGDAKVTAELKGVSHIHAEIKQLLIIRNRYAACTPSPAKRDLQSSKPQAEESLLPPITGNQSGECDRCYQKATCMLYYKVEENGIYSGSGLREEIWESLIGHLEENDIKYFKHWNRLLDMENACTDSYQKEIWTMTGQLRESLGRCISRMRLIQSTAISSKDFSGSKSYAHLFQRHEANASVDTSNFIVGSYVTISIENLHVGIMSGRIKMISKDQVEVSSSHALRLPKGSTLQDLSWRIDIDEMHTGMRMVKNNLVQLFVPEKENQKEAANKLRRLIVALEKPKFTLSADTKLSALATSSLTREVLDSYKKLNLNQQAAIRAVLQAEDYICIQGMPGTGKTTTIHVLVRILRDLGHSVLISSYTHTAVDNLLLKLQANRIPFVRLGRKDQTHSSLHESLLDDVTVGKLQEIENDTRIIVGTTCLSIRHALLSRKRFDYVIIDEAGQITQPVCLGPLLCANKFVLVGDQKQLPPLVKSKEAQELGMDESLFKRLAEAHPDVCVRLTLQFRMNKEIMSLCNTLIYENQLSCGSKVVELSRLKLPFFPQNLREIGISDAKTLSWIARSIDPECPVVFLNTDEVTSAIESTSLHNIFEASITQVLIRSMVSCGLDVGDIGVITPYRSQQALLVNDYLKVYLPKIEVQTVDKYQGRDKECIVISLVRSNINRKVGNLLCDWRRINVAFSRAKVKLILLGSKRTLESSPVFSKFLLMAEASKWILNLPKDSSTLCGPGLTNNYGSQQVRMPSNLIQKLPIQSVSKKTDVASLNEW